MSSDVQPRPAASRGRSSTRGGRAGRSRSARHINGDPKSAAPIDMTADEGELGEMKRQYASQMSTLKEMFPDWTDMDLVVALQETDGDIESTIEKITEGNVSQFAEIKKKTRDRARSKAKDPSTSNEPVSTNSRSGRGRGGLEGARGGRGRGDRGRGGPRGGRGGAQPTTGGARSGSGGHASMPTDDFDAWGATATTTDSTMNAWETPATEASAAAGDSATTTAREPPKSSIISDSGPKKTWASMFKTQPAPTPPKPAPTVPAAEKMAQPSFEKPLEEIVPEIAGVPDPPSVTAEVPTVEQTAVETPPPDDVSASDLTPPRNELTEDNVEALPDTSQPPPAGTAASTVASTTATPISTGHQAPISRPAVGGYATTALKATATPVRSASFQRKLMEQQEAVVMPGNHAVDRAAVQFGSMGLNGDADVDALDDENEESAETRTQPPQHSPTAQPRTSLPPAPRQASLPAEAPSQDVLPTPKPAPGLPSIPQQVGQASNPLQQGPAGQQYGQFSRYGQPNAQNEQAAQKQYDPFNQQSQQGHYENYPAHSQAPGQSQQQAQAGSYSSAPNDYQSYYTADQQRNAYQNYYGPTYGQHGAQQDVGAAQQRAGSAFGSAPGGESGFPAGQSQPNHSRYGDAQASGHNTPNPPGGGQIPTGGQTQQHMQQSHSQTGHSGGYPYSHPYYHSPYWQSYMNNYNGYGGGYGGPFGGKGGMYGQPHHGFGMSPQSSYEQHSSSPASGFGAASAHGRESGLGGGLGEYGRSGSTQPSQGQQHTATSGGFGGMGDMFGRAQGGFQGQGQPYSQQQGGQQGGSEDALKQYGDAKSGTGPSSSALGQPGRPGSATNNTGGAQPGQSGLPPPQSHQQAFGGYPSHLGSQGSQYGGGLGGLGGHQAGGQNHQGGGGYNGGYGNSFGSYGSYGRGGWGGNYTH